jgi:hypothetical protein
MWGFKYSNRNATSGKLGFYGRIIIFYSGDRKGVIIEEFNEGQQGLDCNTGKRLVIINTKEGQCETGSTVGLMG